ncbi:MAG: phosphate transporter permease subunit PstC [Ignavibacteria bacterium]|nr:phosphate transporter permease subunit PstC [Ignavibacteria bacterium]
MNSESNTLNTANEDPPRDFLLKSNNKSLIKQNKKITDSANNIEKYISHKPLGYGKKLYIGEFFAESVIKVVALVSIIAIFAILFYVIKESMYAFKTKDTTELIKNNEREVVENAQSYNNNSGNLKQETYGSSTNNKNENNDLKQDTYKPESYSSDDKELVQETYSTSPDIPYDKAENAPPLVNIERNASDENTLSEEPVTMKQIFTANDYIDNKPAYIWQPIGTVPKFSFIPLFIGALKVTLIGLLLAAPIGILAAIFSVAFAPKWMKETIKPAIELLAGFPSVVIGFFCLITLATIIQEFFHTTFRLNAFVGGIGMALAVIPIIFTMTEDALTAVPKHMKEASFALGASRWQTAWRVLLPAAIPGVFAAVILGFGRAFGETMIALMATGNAALVSANIFESVRTMSATIGSEMAEVEFRSIHYGVLFLIGSILFIITFSLNAIAEFYIRKKLIKRIQGL